MQYGITVGIPSIRTSAIRFWYFYRRDGLGLICSFGDLLANTLYIRSEVAPKSLNGHPVHAWGSRVTLRSLKRLEQLLWRTVSSIIRFPVFSGHCIKQ